MLSGKVVEWLESVGMYLKFSDVNIHSDKFETMADDVMRMFGDPKADRINSIIPTGTKDIINVYKMCS